jgi:hypothetical protein
MTIKIINTCPLGSTCEKINGDVIERCCWYVEMEGRNPQSDQVIKESRCAIAWQVILGIEGNSKSHSAVAAIVDLRNTVIDGQNAITVRNIEAF